jgi:hypothetical protein
MPSVRKSKPAAIFRPAAGSGKSYQNIPVTQRMSNKTIPSIKTPKNTRRVMLPQYGVF